MKKIINRGFTLIELLIVMAILGVLAVVVLVAINPAEQLARTRDAGRASTVTQLGHGVQAYYTSKAAYPVAGTTWITTNLVASGEMGSVPGAVTAAGYSACGTSAENGWCYVTGASDTVVYARMESKQYIDKCPTGTPTPWFLFSTIQGKGGTVCTNGAEPGATGSYTFY